MAQKGLIKQDLSKELVRGKQAAFQYKPVEDTQLAWLSRTENQRNYLESERKIQEQRDLRNKLLLQKELGLDTNTQNSINAEVDDIFRRVREEGLDPTSPEFLQITSELLGKGKLALDLRKQEQTVAPQVLNRQSIAVDPTTGTAFDKMNEALEAVGTTSGNTLDDNLAEMENRIGTFSSSTEAQVINSTVMNAAADAYIKNNTSLSAFAQDMPGYSGITLIKEIVRKSPELAKEWNDYIDSVYGTAALSIGAKAGRVQGTEGNLDVQNNVLTPYYITPGDYVTDVSFQSKPIPKRLSVAERLAIQKANTRDFVNESSSTTDLNSLSKIQQISFVNDGDETITLGSLMGSGETIITQNIITSNNTGKELTTVQVGNYNGRLTNVYFGGEKGKIVAEVEIPKSSYMQTILNARGLTNLDDLTQQEQVEIIEQAAKKGETQTKLVEIDSTKAKSLENQFGIDFRTDLEYIFIRDGEKYVITREEVEKIPEDQRQMLINEGRLFENQ